MNTKIITTRSGFSIPAIGFGTWQVTGQECYDSVLKAIQLGYRHIDTAAIYWNHIEVGKAIKDSGVNRSELFVTTKLWMSDMSIDQVEPAVLLALQELQLEYIDLYLIHWPSKDIDVQDTLSAMQKLKSSGKLLNLGISNCTITNVQKAIDTGITIVNNQVEFHPSLYQKELLEFCKANNIIITAYSPLARGQDLELPVIIKLAKKYNKSTSQIILRWLIQHDIVVIPKTVNEQRMAENLDIFDWNIADEDMVLIDNLDSNNRVVKPSFSQF
jgi:diketogulonate reductase-like aldo/keto reductase